MIFLRTTRSFLLISFGLIFPWLFLHERKRCWLWDSPIRTCWDVTSSWETTGPMSVTTKEGKKRLAYAHKPRSIIGCHLCACDQVQCWGLGGSMCGCVCVHVAIGWWCWYSGSQCRLEHQRLSVALFPHYSSPPSLPSGPVSLPLAAQVFHFVYVLHSRTNTKALSMWYACLHLNHRVYCLKYFHWTRNQNREVLGKSWAIICFQIPLLFHHGYQLFLEIYLKRRCVCVFTSVHNECFLPSTCWQRCSL